MATKQETNTPTISTEEMIAVMMKEIAALKVQLEQQNAKLPTEESVVVKRADRPEAGGGWIVHTPRHDYSGVTHGIEFKAGTGVVDEDRENADLIVNRLEHDFGYRVIAVDAQGIATVRKQLAGVRIEDTKSVGEKLAVPAYR